MQSHPQRDEGRPDLFAANPIPSADNIAAAASRLREATRDNLPVERVAAALAEACLEMTNSRGEHTKDAISAMAHGLGWSYESLSVSLAAALQPFLNSETLAGFARSLRTRHRTIGFVMAGNIPGAGLHETIAALLAGCAAIVKTATAEPVFFPSFAAALRRIDPQLGERITVFNWPRQRDDLTAAMHSSCDVFVAFGDDDTIARLQSPMESSLAPPFAGFGARVSGIALTRDSLDQITIDEVAGDIARFEQRGCLSPHHVFVQAPDGEHAVRVASRIADALERISQENPPARLSLEDAAAIRRAREIARWRSIGDHDVRLWEGARLNWTVIYDRDANFTRSPGYRTVFVSPFSTLSDLERRLDPAKGRVEAFALAAKADRDPIEALLRECGATYICEPGLMQSPPPQWPHGGGAFLRLLREDR